jgi:hypothetical protein
MEGVNLLKVPYTFVWNCHNELLLYANSKIKLILKKDIHNIVALFQIWGILAATISRLRKSHIGKGR